MMHAGNSDQCATSRSGAFSLMEMLVVIAIISTLAALLLPSVENAMEQARRINCLNTQKQFYLAIQFYADAHDGFYQPHAGLNATDYVNGAQQAASIAFRSYVGVWPYPTCPSIYASATSIWDQYYIGAGQTLFSPAVARRDRTSNDVVTYGGFTRHIPVDELVPFVTDPNRQGGPSGWRPVMHAARTEILAPEGANAVFKDGHGEFRLYVTGFASPINRYIGTPGTLSMLEWGIYSGAVYPLPRQR